MRTLIDGPDDDSQWLDRVAAERGKSRASMVREAISAYRAEAGKDWIARGAGYWKQRRAIGDAVESQRAMRQDSDAAESREEVRALLRPFEVVELDERTARLAADIRYRQRMKLLDAMILATAQVNGAILVTRNTRDFPASMPGIRVPYTL